MPITTLFSKFADSFTDESEKRAIINIINYCEGQEGPINFDDLLTKTEHNTSDILVEMLSNEETTYDDLKDFLIDKLISDVDSVVGTCVTQNDLESKINAKTNGIDYNGLFEHLKSLNVITDIKDISIGKYEAIKGAFLTIPCSNSYVKSLANYLINSALNFDESIHQSFDILVKFTASENNKTNIPTRVEIIDTTGITHTIVTGTITVTDDISGAV